MNIPLRLDPAHDIVVSSSRIPALVRAESLMKAEVFIPFSLAALATVSKSSLLKATETTARTF